MIAKHKVRVAEDRGRLTPDDVLVMTRIRQWAQNRSIVRSGKTSSFEFDGGWGQRKLTTADARLVQVIDFERALGSLSEEDQAVLMLIYRDREGYASAARAMRCSERKVAYLLPAARRRLASVLDRMGLL
jgi:DNA-directed RNA polymerase specialized sigma24 family protein